MNEVLHANIFFFIASLATIAIAAAILVALYYIIQILRHVRDISAKLNRASQELERDFNDLRGVLKNEGNKVRGIVDVALGFISTFAIRKKAAPRKHKPKVVVQEPHEEGPGELQ
ncbi:MAG TPA: hypothetical protein VG984_02255 [Candidatus Paceibacterota bacterium]|nr:hypothetical protein [Candidatus Paceibacterota bacterium]